MAINKLSDRELNQKLLETFNIKELDAKKAFEDLMNEKYQQIRNEVKKEVYESLAKQAKVDKERIINSMNELTQKVLKEEKEKMDIHRKNLIKQKLELKNTQESVEKELKDKIELIKEEYNKKLRLATKQLKESFNEQKAKYVQKATKFLNECINSEMKKIKNDRSELANSLKQFSKFISEQVTDCVKKQRQDSKSLDSLKVRLVQEQNEKIAQAKKEFFNKASEKMQTFMTESIKRELNQFRSDIVKARKKTFGEKIFEAFAKEYAIKFFNEDKVVSGLLESLKASNNKLLHASKVTEQMNNKLLKENKELKKVNSILTRNKIINESIKHLPVSKQEMIKKLVKDIPTNQLNESLKKYIPMVLDRNSMKSINNKERVLKENEGLRILTGKNREKINEDSYFNNSEITPELEKEIESIVAKSKL